MTNLGGVWDNLLLARPPEGVRWLVRRSDWGSECQAGKGESGGSNETLHGGVGDVVVVLVLSEGVFCVREDVNG